MRSAYSPANTGASATQMATMENRDEGDAIDDVAPASGEPVRQRMRYPVCFGGPEVPLGFAVDPRAPACSRRGSAASCSQRVCERRDGCALERADTCVGSIPE